MLEQLRNTCRELLEQDKVQVVIGYGEGEAGEAFQRAAPARSGRCQRVYRGLRRRFRAGRGHRQFLSGRQQDSVRDQSRSGASRGPQGELATAPPRASGGVTLGWFECPFFLSFLARFEVHPDG